MFIELRFYFDCFAKANVRLICLVDFDESSVWLKFIIECAGTYRCSSYALKVKHFFLWRQWTQNEVQLELHVWIGIALAEATVCTSTSHESMLCQTSKKWFLVKFGDIIEIFTKVHIPTWKFQNEPSTLQIQHWQTKLTTKRNQGYPEKMGEMYQIYYTLSTFTTLH